MSDDDDDDNTDFISGALASVGLAAEEEKIDEDTLEYITGMLSADPFDEDTRDAVREILVDALSQEGNVDGVEVCESLFALLDISQSNNSSNSNDNEMDNDNSNNDSTPMLRKLSQTVTMKEQDLSLIHI